MALRLYWATTVLFVIYLISGFLGIYLDTLAIIVCVMFLVTGLVGSIFGTPGSE